MNNPGYQKIPGRGRRLVGPIASAISKLWLAPDHLLSVDAYGFFFTFYEKYRRFYFKDIQGITLRETYTSRIVTITCSALLLVILASTLLIHTILPWSAGFIVMVAILAVPCALMLAINLWRGQSCEVKIHTAVQSEILPSINRTQRAERFFALMRDHIVQAQGNLVEGEIQPFNPDLSSQAVTPETLSRPPVIPSHLTRPRSIYFVALSVALLLQAIVTALLFVLPGMLMGAASSLLGVGATVFWLLATIQASKYRVTPELQKYGWIVLGYIFCVYMIAGIYYSVEATENPALAYNATEWLRLMGERPVSESLFLKLYDSFLVLGSGILGLAGLALQRPVKTESPSA